MSLVVPPLLTPASAIMRHRERKSICDSPLRNNLALKLKPTALANVSDSQNFRGSKFYWKTRSHYKN